MRVPGRLSRGVISADWSSGGGLGGKTNRVGVGKREAVHWKQQWEIPEQISRGVSSRVDWKPEQR